MAPKSKEGEKNISSIKWKIDSMNGRNIIKSLRMLFCPSVFKLFILFIYVKSVVRVQNTEIMIGFLKLGLHENVAK